MDYYMHLLPGRIRIRTSALRKNESGVFSVGSFLKTLEGITSVKINHVIGSVLIDYNRNIVSSQMIINQLARNGYFPPFNWVDPKARNQPSIRF